MLIQVSGEQDEHLILYIISCLTGSGIWIVRSSYVFPQVAHSGCINIMLPGYHIRAIGRTSLLTNETLICLSLMA